MLVFVLYLSFLLITIYAQWILKPELVKSLISDYPFYSWGHLPIFILIISYSLLAGSLYALRKTRGNNDLNLPLGGVIAASSLGSALSFLFNFNVLWSAIAPKYFALIILAITPKYFTLIILAIYAVNILIPLAIFSLKKSEPATESIEYKRQDLIAGTRKILAQSELLMVQSKSNPHYLEVLGKKLNDQDLDNKQIIEILDQLLITTKDLPESRLISIDVDRLRLRAHEA